MRERYWMKADLTHQSKEDLLAMQEQARRAMVAWVQLTLEPAQDAALAPDFQCSYAGPDGRALEKADDPIVVRGRWTLRLPESAVGIRVRAAKECRFAVVLNHLKRSATLFPGEQSFLIQRAAH
jgi:hypothetical protein